MQVESPDNNGLADDDAASSVSRDRFNKSSKICRVRVVFLWFPFAKRRYEYINE